MPKSGNPTERYRVIELLLTTGRYTRNELLSAINRKLDDQGLPEIGKEQLSVDLRRMRNEFKVTIETKRGINPGYQYAPDSIRYFSGFKLSKEETRDLGFAIKILKNKSSLSSVQKSIGVINNITSRISQDYAGDIIMLDEARGDVKGAEHIETLYEVISGKVCPLHIEYQKFGSNQPLRYLLSPYVLREFKGMWYVIGFEHGEEKIKVVALDRIKSIRNAANISFHDDPEFDVRTYFRHSIGIIHKHSMKPQKVKLWVRDFTWNYLLVKPLHHTQQMLRKKRLNEAEGYEVQIEVILSVELIYLLLYYADNIRALEPPELVEEMKDYLKRIVINYQ